jgi:para-aminobenzoate synthetase/4-amino-4-deoxychorismate lyase
MSSPEAPLILLQQEDGSWRQLVHPVRVVAAYALADVLPALAELDAATRGGLHAVGYLAYESAPAFDPHLATAAPSPFPLLWFQLGRALEDYPIPPCPPLPDLGWSPEIGARQYAESVRRVRDWIAAGDTYQVNLTYRQHAAWRGRKPHPWLALPLGQPRGAGAYLATSDFVIASASPELFFTRAGEQVLCRPMKGTAPRGRWAEEDLARREALHRSAKNRAENLMITDMVRNDLGRVASPGSVEVRDLFQIERYPTVWQMTSTVEARTRAPLVDLLAAVFPSASVTGAPKVRTMQIIRELETSPRGVYTGAIGWLGPGQRARFNVAIRTLWLDHASGLAQYGTGSGVVWDSDATSEFAECRDKTRVLGWAPPAFELLETIAWRPESEYELLRGHLDRLESSADCLGFACDRAAVAFRLTEAARGWTTPQRVRVLLNRRGGIRVESAAWSPPPAPPSRVAWADAAVDSSQVLLFHKTTDRRLYENARAGHPEVDDVLLWNERGELTESTIANVAVEIDGVWWTPPLDCGLLPGVLREHLLESGRIRERVVPRSGITPDTNLALFNSVRGWWPARLAAR